MENDSKKLENLTDKELLKEKKKLKRAKIINATLTGFLIGIIIWSVAKNTWGLLTLIPLFLIYELVNNSKHDKDLEELLKERNLD